MTRKYSKETIETAVKNSDNYAEVFANLGLILNGGSYPWLKKLIQSFEIDISHFYSRTKDTKKNLNIRKENYNDGDTKERLKAKELKRILLNFGKEEKCSECGINEWRGKKIRLDIDHIDGNCLNNHINNLQFICPNCHRQKTIDAEKSPKKYSYRNKGVKKTKSCSCGTLIGGESGCCRKCYSKGANLPSREVLKDLVWQTPMKILAAEFNLSDVGLRKKCEALGIYFPNNHYWGNYKIGDFVKCAEIRESIENGDAPLSKRNKINWPTNIILQEMLWEKSLPQVSKELNVSRASLKDYIKKRNLISPSNSYRTFQRYGKTLECLRVRKELEEEYRVDAELRS